MTEKNKMVRYDNIVNNLNFRDFTEKDFDIFFGICTLMYGCHSERKVIKYDDLMDLVGWDRSKQIRIFHEKLENLAKKMLKVDCYIYCENEFIVLNLFSLLNGCSRTRTLAVKVNPDFEYVINDLVKNFTVFELREYVNLKGKYSKLLYQHLKQYKTTGWWEVSLKDLRYKLGIPDSTPTMNIKNKMLTPSINCLRECKSFSDLEVQTINSSAKGHAITGYKFIWTPERTLSDVQKEIIESKDKKTEKQSNFNSFQQNEYDFDELEKTLLEASVREIKSKVRKEK